MRVAVNQKTNESSSFAVILDVINFGSGYWNQLCLSHTLFMNCKCKYCFSWRLCLRFSLNNDDNFDITIQYLRVWLDVFGIILELLSLYLQWCYISQALSAIGLKYVWPFSGHQALALYKVRENFWTRFLSIEIRHGSLGTKRLACKNHNESETYATSFMTSTIQHSIGLLDTVGILFNANRTGNIYNTSNIFEWSAYWNHFQWP